MNGLSRGGGEEQTHWGRQEKSWKNRLFRAPGAAEVVSESFCLPAEPFPLVIPFSFAHLDPLPRTAHWDGVSTHCSLWPPWSSDFERVPRTTGCLFLPLPPASPWCWLLLLIAPDTPTGSSLSSPCSNSPFQAQGRGPWPLLIVPIPRGRRGLGGGGWEGEAPLSLPNSPHPFSLLVLPTSANIPPSLNPFAVPTISSGTWTSTVVTVDRMRTAKFHGWRGTA